jgi:integrase
VWETDTGHSHGQSARKTTTSSGQDRVVDLDQATVAALLTHRLEQDHQRALWAEAWTDSGHVFTKADGSTLHPETVTKRFRELSDAAGLRPVRLHDLRHGQASLMLAAGVPMAVVSKRLGHSSIAITSDTYSHLLEGVGLQAATAAAELVPRGDRRTQNEPSPAVEAAELESDQGITAGQAVRRQGLEPRTRGLGVVERPCQPVSDSM